MAESKQKKRIMSGMTVRDARKKLRAIYAEANPGVKFDTRYPGVYVWMETWFRLRARSETFEAVAQAFAEKISHMHAAKHALEQKLHNQRLELAKLQRWLAQKDKAWGLRSPDGQPEPTHFHGHPDGSYSRCDCYSPTAADKYIRDGLGLRNSIRTKAEERDAE